MQKEARKPRSAVAKKKQSSTVRERVAAYRKRRAEEGFVIVQVMINPKAAKALAEMKAGGSLPSEIVSNAIVAYAKSARKGIAG